MTTADGPADGAQRVAVVGGGISGLAAAHRLTELHPGWRVVLFESSPALGGVLRTRQQGEWLLEHSADNFITSPAWGVDLARRIGFEDELIPTQQIRRRAFILRDGKLIPAPEGLSLLAPALLRPIMQTKLLSLRGRLRMLAERFVPRRRSEADESLADFARRRLGKEAFERIVQPLVSGIYTADAEKLSMQAALPRFWAMEGLHGSLIRGQRRKVSGEEGEDSSGARYGLFVAPRRGLTSFVEAIAARLKAVEVRTGTAVRDLRRAAPGWLLRFAPAGEPPSDDPSRSEAFDAVVLATPAGESARLVKPFAPELAQCLDAIEYAGVSLVLAGYANSQVPGWPEGFGFVVPQTERRDILAVSYASYKFPRRAPRGHMLLRTFVGGAMRPDLAALRDAELMALVQRELAELLHVRGEPIVSQILRWPASMPQYHVGHLDRVRQIEEIAAKYPGLELAGNAYRGVGIPHCIASGEQAALRLTEFFR